jgi:glycerol dehydrogenase
LGNVHPKSLMKAAEKACAAGEAIHHEAGLITPEKVLNALIVADALGQARKACLGVVGGTTPVD